MRYQCIDPPHLILCLPTWYTLMSSASSICGLQSASTGLVTRELLPTRSAKSQDFRMQPLCPCCVLIGQCCCNVLDEQADVWQAQHLARPRLCWRLLGLAVPDEQRCQSLICRLGIIIVRGRIVEHMCRGERLCKYSPHER